MAARKGPIDLFPTRRGKVENEAFVHRPLTQARWSGPAQKRLAASECSYAPAAQRPIVDMAGLNEMWMLVRQLCAITVLPGVVAVAVPVWIARRNHQDPDAVAAAVEHYRRRRALGFSDCLVLEVARKAGHLPLGTFDRNLAKLAGAERL